MKTAEQLLEEIKQCLRKESMAAINDVLDMINEFQKLKIYKYTLIMDNIIVEIGEIKAATELEAEAHIENEIMPKTTATTYFMEVVK